MRYNRQKQAIGDETDDTFVKPQAVDDIPFARLKRGSSWFWTSGCLQGPLGGCGWSAELCYPTAAPSVSLRLVGR